MFHITIEKKWSVFYSFITKGPLVYSYVISRISAVSLSLRVYVYTLRLRL